MVLIYSIVSINIQYSFYTIYSKNQYTINYLQEELICSILSIGKSQYTIYNIVYLQQELVYSNMLNISQHAIQIYNLVILCNEKKYLAKLLFLITDLFIELKQWPQAPWSSICCNVPQRVTHQRWKLLEARQASSKCGSRMRGTVSSAPAIFIIIIVALHFQPLVARERKRRCSIREIRSWRSPRCSDL